MMNIAREFSTVPMLALAVTLFMVQPGEVTAQEPQPPGEMDRFLDECPEDQQEEREKFELSDECIPLLDAPDRPKGILELGNPFLGTGTLGPGFHIPGGAVWQPALLAFGTLRTSVQGGTFGDDANIGEAVTRFDLFGNLYLTQTERVVIGLRPLDQEGRFTRFTFADPAEGEMSEEGEFTDELNVTVGTLFFEGDIASLIPRLDLHDTRGLDIYFSVGRQPIAFQDGILLNEDALDMVGLTRANMSIFGSVNGRVTGIYGWGQVTRHGDFGNVTDDASSLAGLFTEFDYRSTTVEFDAVYVRGDSLSGDGLHLGAADIRRFGRFNNTFRALASFPIGDETPFNRQGFLIHNQFGWTPVGSHDWWYIGAFAGIQQFRSAARGPGFGGPVGQTGVLFAAPGIGRVGSALTSTSDEAFGVSLGHQRFFAETRRQLLVELGGRVSTADEPLIGNRVGAGARYQIAMGRRFVAIFDGTAAYDLDQEVTAAFGRFELLLKL